MNIFKEARKNEKAGNGYKAGRFKIIWQDKKVGHNYIGIEWGIRWSDFNQILPIWNTSHNNRRSLTFGIWKLYFQINYNRKYPFNQSIKFIFRNKLRKLYQLFC